ncbi:MAG: thiosulfate oxidation carrier protein SoxY [Gammaproteobacteria bacterium]
MSEIDTKRRLILKGGVAAGALGIAASVGLLVPKRVLAAWPENIFMSEKYDEVMKLVSNGAPMEESGEVKLTMPDVAENGAQVPVEVETSIPGVEMITLVVEKNPRPLAARFVLTGVCDSFASIRLKVAETSPVVALVHAGGKIYTAKKSVQVAIGGCG